MPKNKDMNTWNFASAANKS